MRTRASRFSHKQMIAQASRKQISRRPRASRSSPPDLFHDGLHIPHDSCQLFTCPTFATVYRSGFISDNGSEVPCLCNVIMSFCFSKVLALDKSKNCNVNLAARYLRHKKNAPTKRAPKHRQGHSHHYEWQCKSDVHGSA